MDSINFFCKSFSSFFMILTPFMALPIFLSLTSEETSKRKNEIAFKAIMVATIFLTVFLLFGNMLLNLLGISEESFKIFGGILLFICALKIIIDDSDNRHNEFDNKNDIYIFPLAIPVIAGPGAAMYTIALSNESQGLNFLILILSLISSLFITYIILILGKNIYRWIGINGINTLKKISGIILGGMSIQIIKNVLFQYIT